RILVTPSGTDPPGADRTDTLPVVVTAPIGSRNRRHKMCLEFEPRRSVSSIMSFSRAGEWSESAVLQPMGEQRTVSGDLHAVPVGTQTPVQQDQQFACRCPDGHLGPRP